MSLFDPKICDPPPIPLDQQVHIYCPDCDYDVTGQTENRCPECGEPFDPHRLFSWATGHALPPTYGPRKDIEYASLAMMALFQPARLARHLPPKPSSTSTFWYSQVLRLIATVCIPLFPILILAGARPSDRIHLFLALQLPLIIPSWICELIIAGLLGRFVEPRSVGVGMWFRFWLTTSYCCTIFLVIASALFASLFLAMAMLEKHHIQSAFQYFIIALFVVPLLMIAWWWRSLGTIISLRGSPRPARTAIIFLIPFIGIATIILGWYLLVLQMYAVS